MRKRDTKLPDRGCFRSVLATSPSWAMVLSRLSLIPVLVFTSCTGQPLSSPNVQFGRTPGGQPKVIAAQVVRSGDGIDIDQPVGRVVGTVGSALGTGAMVAGGGAGMCITGGGATGPYAGAAIVLCLGVITVAAAAATLVGGVAGATLAHKKEEIIRATEALKQALSTAEPVAGIEKALVFPLGTAAAEPEAADLIARSRPDLPLAELKELGVDGVIRVEVTQLDLAVYGRLDPDVQVIITARGRLVDTETGDKSAVYSWSHRGPREDYFDMAENDARPLRAAIQQSYDGISQLIVADLF